MDSRAGLPKKLFLMVMEKSGVVPATANGKALRRATPHSLTEKIFKKCSPL